MPLPTRLRQPPTSPPCHLSRSNMLYLNLANNFLPNSVQFISRISFRSFSHTRSSKPTVEIEAVTKEVEEERSDFAKLKEKVEALDVNFDSCTPGQYDLFYCPKILVYAETLATKNAFNPSSANVQRWEVGSEESVISHKPELVFADTEKPNSHGKLNSSRPLAGESLKLEPLGDELLAYFAERMISKETLQRNNVMQVAGDKKIIAFTYRQNGVFAGCKYRTVEKKYWQWRNTQKTLYGLDDIAEADEIIIVEGEIDKLSVEEAGYRNCVSVPGGAPQTVSLKEIPSPAKDTSFQYIWNCKDYLDKASRIILATDSDIPGQALAEELARRLGRERCWRVNWPKKDEASSYKDANEVLKNLGADALRDAIDEAKSYQMQNLNLE